MLTPILDHLLDHDLAPGVETDTVLALVAALPDERRPPWRARAIAAGCPVPDDADDALLVAVAKAAEAPDRRLRARIPLGAWVAAGRAPSALVDENVRRLWLSERSDDRTCLPPPEAHARAKVCAERLIEAATHPDAVDDAALAALLLDACDLFEPCAWLLHAIDPERIAMLPLDAAPQDTLARLGELAFCLDANRRSALGFAMGAALESCDAWTPELLALVVAGRPDLARSIVRANDAVAALLPIDLDELRAVAELGYDEQYRIEEINAIAGEPDEDPPSHGRRSIHPDGLPDLAPSDEAIDVLARRAVLARPPGPVWRAGRMQARTARTCAADLVEAARQARLRVADLVDELARVCELGFDLPRDHVAVLDALPERWLLRVLEGSPDAEVRAAAARRYVAWGPMRFWCDVRRVHVVDAIADATTAAEVGTLANVGRLMAPVPAVVHRWAERCLAWVSRVPVATWTGVLERLDGSIVPTLHEGVARRFVGAVIGRALDEGDLHAAVVAFANLRFVDLGPAEIRLAEELAAAALRRFDEAAEVEGLRAVLLEALASGADTRAAVKRLRDAPEQRGVVMTKGRRIRRDVIEMMMARSRRRGARGRRR